MYRNIDVHPEDIQFQRFLWRSHPNDNIQEFCLNTVPFGLTCAPFLAIRVLKKLAEDERLKFPEAFQAVMDEFYVDDWLSGGDELDETITKIEETRALLASGGFHLRKWITNDPRLLKNIRSEDIEFNSTIDLNLEPGYKSLGIIWHPMNDQFSYRVEQPDPSEQLSKRQLLSEIARLYDPLGWWAPITIVGKILLQSLWLLGLSWDDPLPTEIYQQATAYRNSLSKVADLRIPIWINYSPNSKLELHGFCDASNKAYAAAVYSVARNDVSTYTHLIMTKTKVAPVKVVSTPRLELCGAVLLAKLVAKVKESLQLTTLDTWLWTDSEIVLQWLKGHPSRWTSFVANRTTDILQTVGNTPWRHVPSKENPADLASRGTEAQSLMTNSLWWQGPSWLCGSRSDWPQNLDIKPTEMEKRKNILIHNTRIDSEPDTLLNRFSSMTRLIRVTAYCFRFFSLLTKRTNNRGYLTTTELKLSFNFWVKHTQEANFSNEISNLQQGKPVDKRSSLVQLLPFVDGEGLLRVGGRLTNSTLPYNEKHPLILPNNCKLVELLLEQLHQATLHGQVQLMLNTIRKRFWILRSRNSIKRMIRKCITCFRATAKISKQLMGSYPANRVVISRPFTHTGVDFCGPFALKNRKGRGCKLHKGYVAVFVCLAVKAIHLEIVSDLTTPAFLAALRRFMGRRGLCKGIYSDCGTNFVGANAELNRQFRRASNETAELLANDDIEWHFIPPASPHFGGLWEAGIKSVKQPE